MSVVAAAVLLAVGASACSSSGDVDAFCDRYRRSSAAIDGAAGPGTMVRWLDEIWVAGVELPDCQSGEAPATQGRRIRHSLERNGDIRGRRVAE